MVIYTAITDNYDSVKPFPVTNATHIHFNEPIFYQHKDPSRRAKYCKIMAHKVLPRDTKYSMWVDGSIQLNQLDFKVLIDKYLKTSDIAVLKHSERDCIFKEAQAVIALKKDDTITVLDQMIRYNNFPHNWGLGENGIILRRHSMVSQWLNELWWEEIVEGSKRDQLSLPYVLHKKLNIPCTFIEDRSFFTVKPHNISNNPIGLYGTTDTLPNSKQSLGRGSHNRFKR